MGYPFDEVHLSTHHPSSTRRHGAVFDGASTMPRVVVLSALTGEELLSANYEHLDGPGGHGPFGGAPKLAAKCKSI